MSVVVNVTKYWAPLAGGYAVALTGACLVAMLFRWSVPWGMVLDISLTVVLGSLVALVLATFIINTLVSRKPRIKTQGTKGSTCESVGDLTYE